MPKYIYYMPFLFLFITALTGVWMRLFVFSKSVHIIPYDHLLHGHSHIAILGWTFLAAFIIFLVLGWRYIERKKQAIILCIILFIVTIVMFFAFLYEGYALYSIILSTCHIFVEYWIVFFMFTSLKKINNIPSMSKLFIKLSGILLVISSAGPFSLGAIASLGLRDSPFFDMAIYFYLHFQYNGWLFFVLIGLFIWSLQQRHIIVNETILKKGFWIYFVALFPGFFLSILWYDLSWFGPTLSVIGGLGQFLGVIFILYSLWEVRHKFNQTFQRTIIIVTSLSFMLLFIKAMMDLGLMAPSLASIIYDTRPIVIGYLHLTLLGFITMLIFSLFSMTRILHFNKKHSFYGLILFLIGFILNEGTLFSAGLLEWMAISSSSLQNNLLVIASFILLCSTIVISFSIRHPEKISLITENETKVSQ